MRRSLAVSALTGMAYGSTILASVFRALTRRRWNHLTSSNTVETQLGSCRDDGDNGFAVLDTSKAEERFDFAQ